MSDNECAHEWTLNTSGGLWTCRHCHAIWKPTPDTVSVGVDLGKPGGDKTAVAIVSRGGAGTCVCGIWTFANANKDSWVYLPDGSRHTPKTCTDPCQECVSQGWRCPTHRAQVVAEAASFKASRAPKCECGAAAVGAEPFKAGHSTWCPVSGAKP